MNAGKQAEESKRKSRSLEDEIAAQRDKLKKLEEKKREQERKEKEKNNKAVLELIKAEKLDTVSADLWKTAMPAIKEALKVGSE